MEESQFRTRAQGAVDSERMQLLSILAHHWEELESYEYGGGTQKQKWDLWEMIGNEFNLHPSVTVTRTPLQVKTLFKNMKTKARKYKVKLESSETCGIIVESDPVSETVLQLTKVQSKESLKSLLESLKSIRYFDPKNGLNQTKEMLETSSSHESHDFPDWRMAMDSEDVPDIKEEVIEAFDSPCIIREDESPISFPLNEEQSELSSDEQLSSTTDKAPTQQDFGTETSEVHTFGDISVTPIASEKKVPQNGLKVVSPVSLGLSVRPHNSLVSDSSESVISDRSRLQPRTLFSPLAMNLINLQNLMDKETAERHNSNSESSNNFQNKFKNLSAGASLGKSDSGRMCCCPEYHKQMLNLACKEHEIMISLLNEKILSKREERRLHEEERRFREQSFLLKQEERRAAIAEHQARMKLIELECEAAQKRIKTNERSNKWLLRNGSKEI